MPAACCNTRCILILYCILLTPKRKQGSITLLIIDYVMSKIQISKKFIFEIELRN